MDELSRIRNGCLYSLLSVCNDEELEPLVNYIRYKFTNSLIFDKDFDKYRSSPSKYYKKIGDEIRSFGGNTYVNFIRGEGPEYKDVLIDVCKMLNIPVDKSNVVKNEFAILDLYLEKPWYSLNEGEKKDFIDSTAYKLYKEMRSFKSAFKFRLPTRSGLEGPAFSVTVPCVMHVAYLRRKYLDGFKGRAIDSGIESPNEGSALVKSASSSLLVGRTEDAPLIKFTSAEISADVRWTDVGDEKYGVSRLNSLLQFVPAVATATEVGTTRYMEVIINGPLAEAAEGDYRAWTLENGKIKKHAILKDPSRLKNIVNAAALFQVASVVVAQKHLADINTKLDEIKLSVVRIYEFLQVQRQSALTGAIDYFEEAAVSVLGGEQIDSVRIQLENKESDLLIIQNSLVNEIGNESQRTMTLKDGDSFGSKGMQTEIDKQLLHVFSLYEQLLLCIRARVYGLQLLMLFPGDEVLKKVRKANIIKALGSLDEQGNILKNTDAIIRKKIKMLDSLWNSSTTLNERKLILLEKLDSLPIKINLSRQMIVQGMNDMDKIVREKSEPVCFLAKIENGEIVAISTV